MRGAAAATVHRVRPPCHAAPQALTLNTPRATHRRQQGKLLPGAVSGEFHANDTKKSWPASDIPRIRRRRIRKIPGIGCERHVRRKSEGQVAVFANGLATKGSFLRARQLGLCTLE